MRTLSKILVTSNYENESKYPDAWLRSYNLLKFFEVEINAHNSILGVHVTNVVCMIDVLHTVRGGRGGKTHGHCTVEEPDNRWRMLSC